MNTATIRSGLALAALFALGATLPVATAQAEKPRMGSDGGHTGGGGRESGAMPGGRSQGAGNPGGVNNGGERASSGSRGRLGAYHDDGPRRGRDDGAVGRGRYDNSYRGHDAYRGDGRRYYDNRYAHGHYYPSRGSYVDRLPYRHVIVHHHRDRYYYGDGIWYRPYGGRYLVTRPAVGLYVSFLPAYATTVWYGGDPYYYANDVYYSWRPSRRVYEVVDPPSDSERSGPVDDPEDVYVYPRDGQSPEQQDRDRYECHRWAVDQAGFDPSEAGGGVERGERADKRDDYSRALAACLEGRGYTVR